MTVDHERAIEHWKNAVRIQELFRKVPNTYPEYIEEGFARPRCAVMEGCEGLGRRPNLRSAALHVRSAMGRLTAVMTLKIKGLLARFARKTRNDST